jgi:hypothetical protein
MVVNFLEQPPAREARDVRPINIANPQMGIFLSFIFGSSSYEDSRRMGLLFPPGGSLKNSLYPVSPPMTPMIHRFSIAGDGARVQERVQISFESLKGQVLASLRMGQDQSEVPILV